MKTEVLRVDVRAKTLTAKPVNALDEQAQKYSFDKLVITTGSIAAVPPIHGVRADNVLLCKTWRDGLHIKEHTSQAHSVVVVGAGYIGAELAEQLNLRGVKVTLIDALDRVLANNYDEPITKLVEHAYQSHGVKLALGQRVTEFRQDPAQPGGTQGVTVVTQAGEYHADYAIIAAGFLPATQLVRNQLDTLDNGAIIVDEYMRTSVPDVYAAGDSATVLYNPTGKLDYIPLATNAVHQGLLIGQNIDEPTRAYMGTQATSGLNWADRSRGNQAGGSGTHHRAGRGLPPCIHAHDGASNMPVELGCANAAGQGCAVRLRCGYLWGGEHRLTGHPVWVHH